MVHCVLLSKGPQKTIVVKHNDTFVLGRGLYTGVQDKRCSRRQVEVTADCGEKELRAHQLGANPSWVDASVPVQTGETVTLQPGQHISLLKDLFDYLVEFKDSDSEVVGNQKTVLFSEVRTACTASLQEEIPSLLRAQDCANVNKRSQSISLCGESFPPAKRLCTSSPEAHSCKVDNVDGDASLLQGIELKKDLKNLQVLNDVSVKKECENEVDVAHKLHTPSFESGSNTTGVKKLSSAHSTTLTDFWRPAASRADTSADLMEKDHQQLAEAVYGPPLTKSCWVDIKGVLVFKQTALVASSRVAAFDMDGTLICTKSGKVFATGPDDWQLWHAKVKDKLSSLHARGYKVVIFTNQQGIGRGRVDVGSFKCKVEAIARHIGVPLQLMAATSSGENRKPFTGMWRHLIEKENNGIKVNIDESFYVGDAAGRQANWQPGKKKDFSCSDRMFATNLSLKFHTPEEFFLGQRPAAFKWGGFDPRTLSLDSPACDDHSVALVSQSAEVVVMVGYPGSGKTSFCKKYLLPSGYLHVNRDTEGSWQKCVSATEAALRRGGRVVVDNTSPDVESRARYVSCARKAGVPVRCFVMSTSLEHAKHNNRIRSLTAVDGYHAPDERAFNMYRSKYTFPVVSEGFSAVVLVNFVPHFDNDLSKQRYMQFSG